MNIPKSLPALNAGLAMQLLPNLETSAGGVSDLFDSPPDARDDVWRRARRARQEWREQRYTRLTGG